MAELDDIFADSEYKALKEYVTSKSKSDIVSSKQKTIKTFSRRNSKGLTPTKVDASPAEKSKPLAEKSESISPVPLRTHSDKLFLNINKFLAESPKGGKLRYAILIFV